MHTPIHQDLLKQRKGIEIDIVIAQITKENPEALHTERTLAERVFVDQPGADVPCKGFFKMRMAPSRAA